MVVMYESEMTCAALAGCMEQRSYDGVLRVMTLKTKSMNILQIRKDFTKLVLTKLYAIKGKTSAW